MKYAYTNEQMRAMDARTIANGTPSSELMERAGKALAERVLTVAREREIGDVLFVCGGGNNGGDGFCAARYTRESGLETNILCLAQKLSPDCEEMRARYCGECFGVFPRRRFALVVDCVFGTGLKRAIEGESAALIDFINNSGAYVIACDMPSGLSGEGVAFEPCVRADETVCIGQLKTGLLLADGADYAGEITVCKIGIDPQGERGAGVWEKSDAARLFPRKRSHSHKGSYGSAAIIAGDAFSGAAFLSAGACLKSGAGYTRLYVSKALYPSAVGKLPAVVLRQFSGIDQTILQCGCIALGMGMGVSEGLYALVKELLLAYTGTLIVDADALNALAKYGAEILKNKKCRVILTPHIGEFSRLCKKSADEILAGGVQCACDFAAEYDVTLVLKNNRTIVAQKDWSVMVTAGSPCLAKGGSGDVLAGFMAGTVARGIAPFDAACCASYVLGSAGELAALDMGEYAPDAQDVIAFLPCVMKELDFV